MTADIMKNISVSHPGVPIKVPAVQGDTGRRILFTVTDMDIPSGSYATIYAKKPSGAEIYNSCSVSQSSSGASVITVDLTSATLEEPGEIPAQIQVVNGEDVVTTFLFWLCVQKNIITDSAIEGKDEFTALEKATAAAKQATDDANQAKQDADEAAEAANKAAAKAEGAASEILPIEISSGDVLKLESGWYTVSQTNVENVENLPSWLNSGASFHVTIRDDTAMWVILQDFSGSLAVGYGFLSGTSLTWKMVGMQKVIDHVIQP